MKVIHSLRFPGLPHLRITTVLMLVALLPFSTLSQTSSGASSLRGTAKIKGRFVVRGVMVVLVQTKNDNSLGTPSPAWVGPDGEYRIDALSPGSYTLTVAGTPIRPKVVPNVRIEAGRSNIRNIVLEEAEPPTKLTSKVRNSQGKPIKNAKVEIYSAELPPSVCAKCVLAESVSNDEGEVQYSQLPRGQNYSLAVSFYDESNKRELKLVAANVISLGNENLAQLELQLGEGSHPALSAKLLRDIEPRFKRDTPSPQLAHLPDSETPEKLQKFTLKGVVTRRDADTFTVRNMNGVDTVVRLDDRTSVKTKGGFLRGGSNYAQTSILRGLNVEVEGRGSGSGELTAEKIRFNESDMLVARAVESRAAPLEERASDTESKLSQVEANAQRLSGQMDELAAISNAARGGAKAAQATADAAVAGVNATNERISALDDYTPQNTAAVNFRSGSAELSPESKTRLDEIASEALNTKGYVLEISGFADSRGSVNLNRALSQRRADAVIRYLVENHNIPLRRIVTPYGFGEMNPVAENTSREGRAQNRRVEIKLLVNKGLTSPTPTIVPNG